MVHPIPFHLMQDPEAVVECAARYIARGSKIVVVHDPKTIKAQGDRTHVIAMEFKDEQALKDYANSDAQKKWYEVYRPVRERSTTFDVTN